MGLGLITEFTGLFDTVRDYTLQFTITQHSHFFNNRCSVAASNSGRSPSSATSFSWQQFITPEPQYFCNSLTGCIFLNSHIGGGGGPNWVHSARQSLNDLLYLPRVIVMMMENLMEWRLAGETEVLGESLPQRHWLSCLKYLGTDGTNCSLRVVVCFAVVS
jgi:hypothetical protein